MSVLGLNFNIRVLMTLIALCMATKGFAQPKEVPKNEQSCSLVNGATMQYFDGVAKSLDTPIKNIELVKTIRSERYGCGFMVKIPAGSFYCQISSIQNDGSKYFAHTDFSSVYCERR